MSFRDAILLAFRRSLCAASVWTAEASAELWSTDRGRFNVTRDAAWTSHFLGSFVVLASSQRRLGGMKPKSVRRLVQGLLETGRGAEALEILRASPYGGPGDAHMAFALARALAATGRLEEAAAEIRRIRAMEPASVWAGQLEQTIDEAARLAATTTASSALTDILALADRYLRLGAVDAALGLLRAYVEESPEAPSYAELTDFHHALNTALSLSDPVNLDGLFSALARFYPWPRELDDLRLIRDRLSDTSPRPEPGQWRSKARGLRLSGAEALSLAGRRPAAIEALGALTVQFPKDGMARTVLAREVGREVLQAAPLVFAEPGPRRRVFDVFPYYNEHELLRIKLGEMADWVDYFVVVEATRTFTGAPKPLYFKAREAAFAPFADKIIHVVVDRFPDHVHCAWAREFHQRDMAVRGLSGLCAPDDLVMITDADEIVSAKALDGFDGAYARLLMERSRFFLNYRQTLERERQRGLASVWRAGFLAGHGLSYLRAAFDKTAPMIFDAGWHFTSIADAAGIAQKLASVSHQDFAHFTQDDIARRIADIRAGRLEPGWERCELDDRFPAYVRRHRHELSGMILEAPAARRAS